MGEGSRKFRSMQAETLAGRVSREIIRSILSGEFVPGDLLPTEEKLCEQFGVSRSVVREAMRAVMSVGMTRSRQGRGTEVLDRRSWNDFAPELLAVRLERGNADRILLELLELRVAVEAQAAELAAVRAGAADVDTMRRHHAAMTAAPGDSDVFIEHDIAFHAAILTATRNELVVRLFDLLEPMLGMARRFGVEAQDQPAGIAKAVAEHARILDAIQVGAPREARAAMAEHLKSSASRDVHHELDIPSL